MSGCALKWENYNIVKMWTSLMHAKGRKILIDKLDSGYVLWFNFHKYVYVSNL